MNLMKKVLSIVFSFILAICSISCNSFANSEESFPKLILEDFTKLIQGDFMKLVQNEKKWENKGERIVNLSYGMTYNLKFYVSEEYEENQSDKDSYKCKTVVLTGKFYDANKNKLDLDHYLEVKFKFDGNTAMIEDPEKDIISMPKINETKKLRTSEQLDIYTAPNQCILSNKIEINKKRKWYDLRKTWRNIDDFHADIVCSNDGKITLNFQSIEDLPGQDFSINQISDESTKLSHGVTRRVVVLDKVYKQDNAESDAYEYKTRTIEISYLNKDNKLCLNLGIDANFRYNKATNEVECVSTAYRETDLDDDWEVDSAFFRSGNETKNKGGAYGIINIENSLSYLGEEFEENISIKCDKNGTISNDVILKE